MKDAITALIVKHIETVGPEKSVEIAEYLKMPLGKLSDYLFELVNLQVLVFNPETYTFDIGIGASKYIPQSVDGNLIRYGKEPFYSGNAKNNFNSLEELNRFLHLDNIDASEGRLYHTFRVIGKKRVRIPRKAINLKMRDISAPSLELKRRQRWILDNILSEYAPPSCVHGFVKGKSIKTNALCHINQEEIGCIDIKDFFPSIGFEQVKNVFLNMGYIDEVSEKLARLTTYQGRLPQGAPTSPILSNIIMKPLDIKIMKYAQENGLVYSRYADDITLSGKEGIDSHLNRVTEIIENNGFTVNKQKRHVMNTSSGKKVTGLSVDKCVKVPQSFKRRLRQEIYYCSKYGIASHLRHNDRGDSPSINYMGYLYGKAYFIKMIEPKEGDRFLRQLDMLFSCEEQS